MNYSCFNFSRDLLQFISDLIYRFYCQCNTSIQISGTNNGEIQALAFYCYSNHYCFIVYSHTNLILLSKSSLLFLAEAFNTVLNIYRLTRAEY